MTLSRSEIYKKKLQREEEYQIEKDSLLTHQNVKLGKDVQINKEDRMNLPKHLVVDCPMFQECPADGKCRSYDLSTDDCKNCILTKQDMICYKRLEMHAPDNLNRLYANHKEVIDIDEFDRKRNIQ